MTLWPLTLLLLFASIGALDGVTINQLSWTAQRPYLRGLQSEKGLLYSSMCVGSKPELVRRCIISAARWRYVVKERDIPLVYYVKDFPQESIQYLKSLHNVFVVELSEMEWLPSERYPTPPNRFYSFYKLAAFNLYGYRVLWFDSDAYLFQSPHFLFDMFPQNATGDEVLAWKAESKDHHEDYFNSGIMVFMPNRRLTQRIYETWASGDFRMHFKVSQGKELLRLTEQEVLLTVFSGKLIPLPNCFNFRTHEKYSMINRRCNITEVVAFHDWEAFTDDMARFCFYWKKAMLMGSSPLLCDADKLADGAPRFTLEDCSPYFTPPSKTNLCDSTSSYSPSFRPTQEEIREHFSNRRRKKKALEEFAQRASGGEVVQEKQEEEKAQVLTFTYDEKTDPTSEHYVAPPKVQTPHVDIKHTLEGVRTEDHSGGADGKHHYLDKFRHHDQQQEQKSDGQSGGGEEKKGDQSSGGVDGKHHYLDKFRHHDQQQEQKSDGLSGVGNEEKKEIDQSSRTDGKHHYLDKFRHYEQQEQKSEGLSGGGNEEKKDDGSSGADGKHHFLHKFRHHDQEQKSDELKLRENEEKNPRSGADGKHHFLDKFRHGNNKMNEEGR